MRSSLTVRSRGGQPDNHMGHLGADADERNLVVKASSICEQAQVVLCIDDVQWADTAALIGRPGLMRSATRR